MYTTSIWIDRKHKGKVMKSFNVSRFVLGSVLTVAFVFGVQATVPVYATDCSQGTNQGGCKQATTEPGSEQPSDSSPFEGLLNQLGVIVRVIGTLY
jgi:hypothetical protein